MNSIRLTVFDVFSYILPGFYFLFIFFIVLYDFNFLLLYHMFLGIGFLKLFLFLLCSYFLGFVMDPLSNFMAIKFVALFRGKLKDRVIEKCNGYKGLYDVPIVLNYQFSHIYSYVDYYSSQVRLKVDQLSAMSGLARNMAMSTLLSSLLIIYYYYINQVNVFLVFFSIVEILVSIMLFFRSDTFRYWSHLHLLNGFIVIKRSVTNEK